MAVQVCPSDPYAETHPLHSMPVCHCHMALCSSDISHVLLLQPCSALLRFWPWNGMLEFAFFKQLLPNTFDVVHRRHPLSCHCLLHRRRSIFAMLRDFRYRIVHWPVLDTVSYIGPFVCLPFCRYDIVYIVAR
jgi:hypothetical protein